MLLQQGYAMPPVSGSNDGSCLPGTAAIIAGSYPVLSRHTISTGFGAVRVKDPLRRNG
jgi:hypothetical protein